jgi:D-tyrosyl-tRNA(Tyr) deacylase
VQTGRFQARMKVHLVNDGPVTIMLDSADLQLPRRSR